MIPIDRHRLIARGDLPSSDGGIYNPGAWRDPLDGRIKFVCRVEVDYSFQARSIRPCSFTLLENRTLTRYEKPNITGACLAWTEHLRLPYGFDAETRFEDLRPFVFGQQVLVAGVRWKPRDRYGYPIKPVLAEWGYPDQMALADEWVLPIPYRPVEKNWVLLESKGRLYTVYALSPLVIFRKTPYGEWALFREDPNDWQADAGAHLKNSTHLVPFRGGYLGWWHLHRERAYLTGAYWLDQDLQLKARTDTIFDGREIVLAPDIYKPGVLYISSQVLDGDDVLLFYGEGDSHSGVATIRQDDLARELGL